MLNLTVVFPSTRWFVGACSFHGLEYQYHWNTIEKIISGFFHFVRIPLTDTRRLRWAAYADFMYFHGFGQLCPPPATPRACCGPGRSGRICPDTMGPAGAGSTAGGLPFAFFHLRLRL